MLVLSRKPQETIEIEGGITLEVIRVDGEQVKIGIVAPRKVAVHRGEVAEMIRRQNARNKKTTNENEEKNARDQASFGTGARRIDTAL